MPTVYVGMTADVLHHGHMRIIAEARKHGQLMIGLLTDSAVANHKRLPYLTWDQRREIMEGIAGVAQVVPQNEWDYSPNLRKYKPEFMVHGDDWSSGPESRIRDKVINALAEYGGQLVEVPYTQGVSSSAIVSYTVSMGTTPEIRRHTLRRSLEAKPISRFLEAHSPISALIAETAEEQIDGETRTFDGFWSSSLTDSTEMGKPDIEALDISARLSNINNIFEVTTKPLIMDGDTGGKPEHFELNIRSMERLGISAVIIEDKTGLKKNSLLGNDVVQSQEDPDAFCEKIRMGRAALMSDDFMIFARIESLILDQGMDDAISRARAYVAAGANGIMIHSRKREPDEVFRFADLFRSDFPDVPLVTVPTTYNQTTETRLADHGFNIVIYANHMLRAAYPAMRDTALSILRNGRSLEADELLISIPKILELIPGTN